MVHMRLWRVRLIESLGGRLETFSFAFGETDAYVIIDVPDTVSAATTALITSASGGVVSRMTLRVPPDENRCRHERDEEPFDPRDSHGQAVVAARLLPPLYPSFAVRRSSLRPARPGRSPFVTISASDVVTYPASSVRRCTSV